MMGEQSPDDVAHDYVAQIAQFHAELRVSGWADHEFIQALSIMQYNPTVEHLIVEMPAFMQKKELASRAKEKREGEKAA